MGWVIKHSGATVPSMCRALGAAKPSGLDEGEEGSRGTGNKQAGTNNHMEVPTIIIQSSHFSVHTSGNLVNSGILTWTRDRAYDSACLASPRHAHAGHFKS